MTDFCRHNRLLQNCPICSREQDVAMRPVVSSSTPKVSSPRPAGGAGRGERTGVAGRSRAGGGSGSERAGSGAGARSSARPGARSGTAVRVRHLARGADDGYRNGLVPGLRSSEDAERLADEIGFSVTRLEALALEPPGLYAEVSASGSGELADSASVSVSGSRDPVDLEERTWLAFQIALLGPLDDADPFASIADVRVDWASGALPAFEDAVPGPRGVANIIAIPGRAAALCEAYRAWAVRSGGQAAAFTGETAWTPERRFDRAFERLGSLTGMGGRDARYDLLVTLGRLGVYELRGGRLHLSGENEVTVAAKRLLGIGDPLLLEQRARELADACYVPLESLDLALHNWGTGARVHAGLPATAEPDPAAVERTRSALAL